MYGTDAQPLQIKVGYYTEVAGLGASPGDVRINGKVEVRNRCFDEDPEFTGCFALNNFWRGLSNLTIKVNGTAPGRLHRIGQLLGRLAGGVPAPGGGHGRQPEPHGLLHRTVLRQRGLHRGLEVRRDPQRLAAAVVRPEHRGGQLDERRLEPGLLRNDFTAGVGAAEDSAYPNPPYTVLEKTPLSREKPYLFVDAKGAYQVRVPLRGTNTSGISWARG